MVPMAPNAKSAPTIAPKAKATSLRTMQRQRRAAVEKDKAKKAGDLRLGSLSKRGNYDAAFRKYCFERHYRTLLKRRTSLPRSGWLKDCEGFELTWGCGQENASVRQRSGKHGRETVGDLVSQERCPEIIATGGGGGRGSPGGGL